MIYGSVCSGIEAASVAWHPLGWRAAFVSEIEAFPRAVLKARWPDVPLHGDFTTIKRGDYEPIDVLVGGTPCQDFSIAGRRAGLDGAHGGLTLAFARVAHDLGADWLVWENVPGAFALNDGRDFGAVLACFAGHPLGTYFAPPAEGWRNAGLVPAAHPGGYGLAWRVLDAQYFGVPQRRRRVFVVGHLGDWRRAAAVLFERASLSGDSPPRRQAREGAAAAAALGAGDGGDTSLAVSSKWHKRSGGPAGQEYQNLVAPPLPARTRSGGSRGTDFDLDGGLIAFADLADPVAANQQRTYTREGSHNFRLSNVALAFDTTQLTHPENRSNPQPGGPSPSLATTGHAPAIASGMLVRRLTVRECERLQGLPDDYTLVRYRGRDAADAPRYKALGNSMAVPVMRWIGTRLDLVARAVADNCGPPRP